MKKDIYATITDRFIKQLESGTVPWQKPWSGARNLVSKKQYRGINTLILGSTDFESPYWLTYKQCSDLGGHVKKGERSLPVVYYKFFNKRDDDGNIVYQDNGQPAKVPFIRWSNVFNLTQTLGIDPPEQTEALTHTDRLERAAAIVANATICPVKFVGFQAFYSPRRDEIRMPPSTTFTSQEEFFHTLYHELTHATGHESRLNREGVTGRVRFGSEKYSKEELIAELGAAFLSNEAGILNNMVFENSAAYLQEWTKKLQKDPRLILSAASMAQKSADLILGIEQKEALIESQLSPEDSSQKWGTGEKTFSPECHPVKPEIREPVLSQEELPFLKQGGLSL